MKHQQGAALVVVMAMLAAALLLGVAGMQSALVDERLAGNFRSSVQAQMIDESLLAALADSHRSAQRDAFLNQVTKAPQALSTGDHYRLQPEELDALLDVGAFESFLSRLAVGRDTAQQDSLAEGIAIDIKKLSNDRVAITASRHGQVPDDALVTQLEFFKTDAEPQWQLAGLR
ncbi:PilX N-terminal domain-containing pilus assembly protein [Vreelandella zhanjiangensis]|uniref:PilX N-terminal domain-containing pilus assembly protein n=1 Tax=Vreelandella zhanjiangensis TaxID=1121960 RepID=UPI0003604B95|nr:PilX N-terminal domain-containing pilus assembly protein [Halomonas zhanjiangensis]